MKPTILVTADWKTEPARIVTAGSSYVSAVIDAGAVPVVVAPSESYRNIQQAANDLLDIGSALLLTGGQDVDPVFFNEAPHRALGEVNPVRDEFELALTAEALRRGIPILGICRGMQVLNIAAGGGLIQDIPSMVAGAHAHSVQAPKDHPVHWVRMTPDSRVARLMNAQSIRVNSFHHQSCSPLGQGFSVTAQADDGIVEAIERDCSQFVVGVQWHPECLYVKHPQFQGFFDELARAAQGGMAN